MVRISRCYATIGLRRLGAGHSDVLIVKNGVEEREEEEEEQGEERGRRRRRKRRRTRRRRRNCLNGFTCQMTVKCKMFYNNRDETLLIREGRRSKLIIIFN